MSDQISDDRVESSTVEQLEEALTLDPTNIEKQKDLAQALLDRNLYEEGREQDVERLKHLLAGMPEDRALFERAYLAWLDHDDHNAVENLSACATQTSTASDEPLTSDELWAWIYPFLDQRGHLNRNLRF